jgi:tetratricopeptide (TPR) repeat protein
MAGRRDPADKAYWAGVAELTEALEILYTAHDQLKTVSKPQTSEQQAALDELIELFGARGGMLQRLREHETALSSYQQGAELEERFGLPSTYNRLNAIKCSLLTKKKQLRELEPKIRALAELIDNNLSEWKPEVSESGWAYADLGDCLALLGNLEGARRAYSTFIAKAEIKSPERTLDVLKEIESKLTEFADPLAPRLQMAIDVLQNELGR